MKKGLERQADIVAGFRQEIKHAGLMCDKYLAFSFYFSFFFYVYIARLSDQDQTSC